MAGAVVVAIGGHDEPFSNAEALIKQGMTRMFKLAMETFISLRIKLDPSFRRPLEADTKKRVPKMKKTKHIKKVEKGKKWRK
jgi:hypothetical protein